MPYVKSGDRYLIECEQCGMVCSVTNPGQLNYAFTVTALEYLRTKGLCYDTLNDIMGAFSGAQAEFYRRVVAPYESKKMVENGDVYELNQKSK